MKWAAVSLTSGGAELGKKLKEHFPGIELYTAPGRGHADTKEFRGTLKDFTGTIFRSYDIIIFIMAAGIVVRTIAEFIRDKATDPGIVVMDEKGRFVISLLSGHMGGANSAATRIAQKTGAEPVITTSSDVNGMTSPDMLALRYGCVIDDMKRCREVTSVMVNGGNVALKTDADIPFPEPYTGSEDKADAVVYMTNIKVQEQQKPVVQLIPVNIIIGTGCRKGTDPEALTVFIKDELGKLNIDERSVSAITSIDIKKEEPAITAAAEHFTAGQLFFSAEQIKEVEHLFQQSEFVREKTGAGCVAEPCAYLASGRSGKLILPRTKRQGMTISIMEKPFQEIE